MRFLSDLHLNLFSERNSDKTLNLRLKGKEFWLRYNRRIANKDLLLISTYMQECSSLVALDLCYNNIGNDGLKILVNNYLKFENHLKELNLMCCNIGWEGIDALVNASETITLQSLRVNGNKIGTKGGILLANFCGINKYIEHLDVAESDQTLASISFFRAALEDHDFEKSSLRCLDISRIIPMNIYHSYDITHLANTFGLLLQYNTNLIELHLQKCELDGHDLSYLLDGMKYNKTLLFLDIGYNRIADCGIERISNFLVTKPALLGLNVAGNGITSCGANALHFGLPFSKIRLLDISKNKIDDDGILDILNTIKKPYQLRYLFMYGNNIEENSLKVIDRMLESGVLVEDQIDIKLYQVGQHLKVAYNPVDRYKHKYYHELDLGYPEPVKIKKNKIIEPALRAKIDFKHYPRFPPVGAQVEIPPSPRFANILESRSTTKEIPELVEITEEDSDKEKLDIKKIRHKRPRHRHQHKEKKQEIRLSDPITVDSVFMKKMGLYVSHLQESVNFALPDYGSYEGEFVSPETSAQSSTSIYSESHVSSDLSSQYSYINSVNSEEENKT